MFTGYRPSPAIKFPSFGSVISHEQGSRNNLPPYVVVPNMVAPDQGTGYMSSAFGPFALGSDPADKGFTVRDLLTPKDVDEKRFDRRRNLLGTVDEHFKNVEKADSISAMDSFYQAAYGLISSKQAREAFDLTKESDKLRDEYGRNTAGQRFLLARRLVEAGTRMVSVNFGSWDHHSNLDVELPHNCLMADQPVAALVKDLKQRGLLDSTLVLWLSEFGRTPLGENRGGSTNVTGRDHHPFAFSIWAAGGGIKGGQVIGETDEIGWNVTKDPIHINDLHATVLHLFGLDHLKLTYKFQGRDFRLTDVGGKVVTKLLA